MTHKIEFAQEIPPTDASPAIRLFFDAVLGLNFDSCFVSEESELSDFSFSGVGFTVDREKGIPLSSRYKSWDQWIIRRLKEDFSVEISTTKINLRELFDLLDDKPRVLH